MEIFADTAELIAAPLPRDTSGITAEAASIASMLADLDRLHFDTIAAVTEAGEHRDKLLLADADLTAIDDAGAEIDTLAVTMERIAVASMVLSERWEALAALMQEAEKQKEFTE
jgi:hypothetical protein